MEISFTSQGSRTDLNQFLNILTEIKTSLLVLYEFQWNEICDNRIPSQFKWHHKYLEDIPLASLHFEIWLISATQT